MQGSPISNKIHNYMKKYYIISFILTKIHTEKQTQI